ncbi:MAG TPA: hypothetical protein VGP07_08700 [Polyangia bacterium]|jgi:hypothetical protein
MKTTNRVRPFVLGPVLLAAAVGLALTSSGCVVDSGPDYNSGCQSDLWVDWQIQNSSGGLVTCDAAGAATVLITIDGAPYPQMCQAGFSFGKQDIPLQSNYASYDVTVNLEDAAGTSLAQVSTTVNITYCGTYYTPGPAPLVVQTPSP